MKQNDIALLILVISISLVSAFFIANTFINPSDSRKEEVVDVMPIRSAFGEIDTDVFNTDAINPAQNITVKESDSDKPFSESN